MIGLACSTLSCDGFGYSAFVNSFAMLPQIGFRYVEFNCWHPPDLTPASIRHTAQRCRETELRPAAVYGTAFGGETHHELSKDVCHKLRMIEAACELGCRRIVATGARRGKQGGLDAIIAVLREIAPYAEERDVLICLENHANNNLETIEDYEQIFAAAPSPAIGLCIDTGHFDAAAVALDDVVDRLGEKVNHIHVKEAATVGEEGFVSFGQGITDNHRLIRRMLERGYTGYISVEFALPDKSNLLADLSVPYQMFAPYET